MKLFTDRIRVLELGGATVPEIKDQFRTKHGCARDANFQDAEIVRSEERRGLGPRERPQRGAGAAPLQGARGNMSPYI